MNGDPTNTEPTHEEFTPGPEDVEYPSTLRITSLPAEQAQAAAIERAEQWEQGEEVPHVVNFEDRARLRQLLTDRRMELLEEVMEHLPESIRALADRLDRDVYDVHNDLHLLAEYGIIYYQESGLRHPGSTTPEGTAFDLDTLREFRFTIRSEDDLIGQRKFNAHLAPRWPGMRSKNGTDIPVPGGFGEGVNVRVSGSNIEFTEYLPLLQRNSPRRSETLGGCEA